MVNTQRFEEAFCYSGLILAIVLFKSCITTVISHMPYAPKKMFFKVWTIIPVPVYGLHFLKDIETQFNNCLLLGDKGYLSSEYQLNLFENNQIKPEAPMRKNQLSYQKQTFIFQKSRKRIETLFSQFCGQSIIRRNYAKSFAGFKTRILSKITTLTIIQFINNSLNRNINNLKINIA